MRHPECVKLRSQPMIFSYGTILCTSSQSTLLKSKVKSSDKELCVPVRVWLWWLRVIFPVCCRWLPGHSPFDLTLTLHARLTRSTWRPRSSISAGCIILDNTVIFNIGLTSSRSVRKMKNVKLFESNIMKNTWRNQISWRFINLNFKKT